MVASALSHFFIGATAINKKWCSQSDHGRLWKRGVIRCSSYKENFQVVKQNAPSFTPSELNLPFASLASPSSSGSEISNGSNPSADEAPMATSQTNADPFDKALKSFEKMTVAQFAIYGGLIAGGLFILRFVLNSFETLPLLPETMQIVGVLYAIFLASRLFQGKPLSLTPSPVKAITELVERKGYLMQRTNLELPQDLDERVLAKMEQLSRERDDAVNKLEVLRRRVADYARVVAEKEALEAVAVQLAQERDEAMSEVIALKKAVDAMSDRMRIVENTLQQDLEPLKQSSQALETVALQLASERDFALKELSELKDELVVAKCKEEEKAALETLASQLVEERDKANLENERFKKMLASIPAGTQESAAGLSSEQELLFKEGIDAAGVQFMDLAKPYMGQREGYLKHFLEERASESSEALSSSSRPEKSDSEPPQKTTASSSSSAEEATTLNKASETSQDSALESPNAPSTSSPPEV